jgi:HTH-type transcriptional regulator/antitoxin HigA
MDEMGVTVSPEKYRTLVSSVLPKVIENDRELEQFSEQLEKLDRLDRDLTPEEKAIEALLAKLIEDYEQRIELPDVAPAELIAYLMEHRGIRQADLVPVFGSRGIASEVLSGKREPSKAHIRKLAEFFHVSPAAFL